MKKFIITLLFFILFALLMQSGADAQCSICSKTAQQMGEKPALGINNGILYLIFMPFALVGVIGYKWWKSNKDIW